MAWMKDQETDLDVYTPDEYDLAVPRIRDGNIQPYNAFPLPGLAVPCEIGIIEVLAHGGTVAVITDSASNAWTRIEKEVIGLGERTIFTTRTPAPSTDIIVEFEQPVEWAYMRIGYALKRKGNEGN